MLITWPYSEQGKNKIPGLYRTVVGQHDLGEKLYLGDKLQTDADIAKLIRWLGDLPCVVVNFQNPLEIIHGPVGMIDHTSNESIRVAYPDRKVYGITPNSKITSDPEAIKDMLGRIDIKKEKEYDIEAGLKEIGFPLEQN